MEWVLLVDFVVSVSIGSSLGLLVDSTEPPCNGGKHDSCIGVNGGVEVKSVGPLPILLSSSSTSRKRGHKRLQE
jgi:hypothetical protein